MPWGLPGASGNLLGEPVWGQHAGRSVFSHQPWRSLGAETFVSASV